MKRQIWYNSAAATVALIIATTLGIIRIACPNQPVPASTDAPAKT